MMCFYPFRNLLAREHRRIRGEYEDRLRELERERQTVEEDKAQVSTCRSWPRATASACGRSGQFRY
jgi:hypothetical protein